MSEQSPRGHSEVPGPAQAEAEQIHSESALDFQWDTALVRQLLLAHPFLPAQHPRPLGWASFSQARLSCGFLPCQSGGPRPAQLLGTFVLPLAALAG